MLVNFLTDYIAPIILFLITIITVFGRLKKENGRRYPVTRIGYLFLVLATIALFFSIYKAYSDRKGSDQLTTKLRTSEALSKVLLQKQDSMIDQLKSAELKNFILQKNQEVTITKITEFTKLFETVYQINTGQLSEKNAAKELVNSIVDFGILSQQFDNQNYENVLKVNFEQNDHWKISDKAYSVFGTVYCQFGKSSTKDGYELFDKLNTDFANYLKEYSFQTSEIAKESLTGWYKTLYSVKMSTSIETLIGTETEWSPNGVSGYFKIYLLHGKKDRSKKNSTTLFTDITTFKSFLRHLEDKDALTSTLIEGNEINENFPWSGREFSTLYQIKSESRRRLKSSLKHDLKQIFESYLKNENWEIKSLDNDNFGQKVYRVLMKATKGTKEFSYVFIAEDKRGDWSQELVILKDGHNFKRVFGY